MDIMNFVLPDINFWFLLALLLTAFILGMVVSFRMFTTRGYYRDIR